MLQTNARPSLIAAMSPARRFALIAAALTALRVLTLVFADANLGPDEAQYWVWSKDLDFGYFSKPPLIAWIIAATTSLFGDAEWAVRLAAPFLHLGAALFIFSLSRRLFDGKVAFWSGLGWLLMPGVSFSSALITTDAPLLFSWSAALYFFFALVDARAQAKPAAGLALLLGLAIGLGFLAKYAMIYFFIGAGVAAALSPEIRRGLRISDAAIAGAAALLLAAPNIWWNAQNEFSTIAHTAANANWGADMFHPVRLAEFIGSQFGVFGPISFGLLVWGASTLSRGSATTGPDRERCLALAAFVAPPLLIVCVQAFLSRAHANWAGVAYPAAMILVSALAARARLELLLKGSAALHLAAALAFMAVFTHFSLADRVGLSNAVKRLRGWEATGADIRAAAAGYDAIVVDDRELMASLLYYARGGPPVVSWNSNGKIDHHFEAFMGFETVNAPRALFVNKTADIVALGGRHAAIAPIGRSVVDLKRGRTRTLYLYGVDGLEAPPP
jgi:4-amino-4-deoxy-L-arabinose transferase-like glycosyltransferase